LSSGGWLDATSESAQVSDRLDRKFGAGKSAVSRRLAALGAVIIDADRLAREVVAGGTDGLAEVVAAFGPEVLGADGQLDRPKLGQRVFGDDAARRRLEGIIHPRVRARTAELTHLGGSVDRAAGLGELQRSVGHVKTSM